MERLAIAMSGGVDSSTAAAILKADGYDLIGFSMRLWSQGGRCCSLDDLRDAREVAGRLGIPYYVLDFREEFERTVVQDFVRGYARGLTPSPCVLCNSQMKFDRLLRAAEEVSATRVATGHYARVRYDEPSGRFRLLAAADRNKDQSYFLFSLNQAQLARAVFPLGGLEKGEVRRIAQRCKLPVADKAESQEICFVPDGDYAAFVESQGGSGREGEIVTRDGRVLGRHRGIHHYTVGQRRGLGIAHSSPLYVIEIRPEENRVVVGERVELERKSFRAGRCNWISVAGLNGPLRVTVKIRSRHAAAWACIRPSGEDAAQVDFESPQMAVTPGQACVFYQGETVIGGGWIERDLNGAR